MARLIAQAVPHRTGAVLQLVRGGNKDTTEALEWLLHEAREGTLTGLSATFMRPGGAEAALSTGAYKARPELVVKASARLMWMLAGGPDE